MRASDFEFRHRFWSIGLVFFVGFSAYNLEHESLGSALARVLFGHLDAPGFEAWMRGYLGFAAALCVLAALLRTWAAAYLAVDVIHDTRLRSESLVADGPYRHVRNPLYLGLLLLAIGCGFSASPIGFAVIVVGMLVLVLRLIGREEAELARAQGAAFEAYCRAVPRLVPSLVPRVPASGRAPRWGEAWLGETFFWIFAIGAVAFAWTRDLRIFGLICIGGMAFYLVLQAIWKRVRAHRGTTDFL